MMQAEPNGDKISEKRAPLKRGISQPSATRGYLLAAGMCLFWGMSWPIMKIALSEIPPWTFRTISVSLGGLGLLAIARAKGLSLRIPRAELWPLLVVAMFNVTGWHLGSAHGISHMQAGRAVIIGFTMPLWATIFSSLILKERMTVRRIVGLLLGMTALFLIIRPQLSAIGGSPLGAGFMLFAAVSWAIGTVLIKYFRWSMSTISLTGWQLTIGFVPVVIGAMLFEQPIRISALSTPAILSMVYVIFFPMIYCHWAYYTIVGIFPASVAAISTLAVPVIGVFSSALVLGEAVGLNETAALLLVVVAIGMVLLDPGR